MLSPQVVLVTGVDQGIGYATVAVAATRDAESTYILCSPDPVKGEEVRKQLLTEGVRAKIEVLQLDVTDNESISRAVESVAAQHGKLDVLIHNVRTVGRVPGFNLAGIHHPFNTLYSANLTSVMVVIHAFTPLLHAAAAPKVINVYSGLEFIANRIARNKVRAPWSGPAKIGMDGAMAHLQMAEMVRVAAKKAQDVTDGQPMIRYYIATSGLLKTSSTDIQANAKDPQAAAEVIVRLMLDHEGKFQHATNWEFEEGEMRMVPG